MPQAPSTPLRLPEGGRLQDRAASAALWLAAAVAAAPFVWLLGDVVLRGAGALSWTFLTAAPSDAGRAGGVGPIIVSTLLILLVCLAASAPLGLAAAVYLAEVARGDGLAARLTRRSLDVLAGVPSIVFGLFGKVFFSELLGMKSSILAGGLTLACMVLPLLIRTTESALRTASERYELGAAALGMSRWSALRTLLFPAAAPGLLAGLILGLGRATAETAALLFTSGFDDRLPRSLFDSGRALSVHVYEMSMNTPGGEPAARGAAVILIVLIAAATVFSQWLVGYWLKRGWSSA